MTWEAFPRLSDHELKAIGDALRAGRLVPPFQGPACASYVAGEHAATLAAALEELGKDGLGPGQIAALLAVLAADRRGGREPGPVVDLVATGPDAPGVASRDTSVVVRELFRHARESVLVVGYVVRQGRHVFQALAERMHELPHLQVRLCLDVSRHPGDTSLDSEEVLVLGKLAADGVVKMQFGASQVTRDRETKTLVSLGDDLKAAATDALKKCATFLGVGLYLGTPALRVTSERRLYRISGGGGEGSSGRTSGWTP